MHRFLRKEKKILLLVLVFLILGFLASVLAYQGKFLPDNVLDVNEMVM